MLSVLTLVLTPPIGLWRLPVERSKPVTAQILPTRLPLSLLAHIPVGVTPIASFRSILLAQWWVKLTPLCMSRDTTFDPRSPSLKLISICQNYRTLWRKGACQLTVKFSKVVVV